MSGCLEGAARKLIKKAPRQVGAKEYKLLNPPPPKGDTQKRASVPLLLERKKERRKEGEGKGDLRQAEKKNVCRASSDKESKGEGGGCKQASATMHH